MSKHGISKLLTGAVIFTLASATVQAKPTASGNDVSKEQKTGMLAGATAGALIGGPFGAAVGFMLGTVVGAGAGKINSTAQTAKSLEQQLAQAQAEFAQLSAAKESDSQTKAIYEQLAEKLHAMVMFRTASAELDISTSAKLNDLGSVLRAYPGLVVEIDGYADPRGTTISNEELSQQRASAVRTALIVGGATPDSIRVAAHGEELSTAPKDDLEAYAWERRVSVSVRTATSNQLAQTH